jgi:hypothetical protein
VSSMLMPKLGHRGKFERFSGQWTDVTGRNRSNSKS